ncbi:MAG TPA: hypothetical protein VGD57_09425 [Candidatus Dormibacteraeota bacterium]
MNQSRTEVMQPKAVSAGMLLLVSGAFALTQLTSLILGPASSRQLNLSLAVPSVDFEDAPGSIALQADAMLGALSATEPAPLSVRAPLQSPHLARAGGSSKPAPIPTAIISSAPTVVVTRPIVQTDHSRQQEHGRRAEKSQDQDNESMTGSLRVAGASISSAGEQPAGWRD